MKANHNGSYLVKQAKIVFINKSKIHFESKSQPDKVCAGEKQLFLSISQRYILKANHNKAFERAVLALVFINKSKIHFESKSQPKCLQCSTMRCFYQ